MKVRRTISIDQKDLEALKPFLESTDNNLSKSIRQLIDEYKKQVNLNKTNGDKQRVMILRNQIIEDRIAELIFVPLVKWFAKKCVWVPPLGTFRVFTEKYAKLLGMENYTIEDYIKIANTNRDLFGSEIKHNIELNHESQNIRISFEAEDADYLKWSAMNFSCIFAHQPLKLKTKKVVSSPNLIIIDYEQGSNEEEAYKTVIKHFGQDQIFYDDIQTRIQYWKNIVNILKADHYEDLIISKDTFEEILKSHDFSNQLSNLISGIYNISIENTDYKNITRFIDEILRTNGLIYKMEHGCDELRLFHKFDDKCIISLINKTVINVLEMSGQHFIIGKEDKLAILNRKVV